MIDALPMPGSAPTPGAEPTTMTCLSAQAEVEELADQARNGSRSSFEALVAHFEKRIFNYLYQMTRNQHDAEDLTQVTFLKAYQNIHRYQSNRAFTAWLFTIAKRTALNHFRDTKPVEELGPDLPDHREDPSVQTEREDAFSGIWRLAKCLKPDYYEALWLRYGEGFSISETARIMRTNSLRVRVILHRARAALAKKLGQGNNREGWGLA
ncbi:MAG: RNA polymerase sigma factor [Verrucomicrobiota bacterium]